MAEVPSARRAAWYAARPGGWRDWVTILHLPYTGWHLSYVLIGAGLAPRIDGSRLAGTVVAFGLAVGIGAHALDELRGRPLGTTIAAPALMGAAGGALCGAAGIGIVGITRIGWGLAPFIVAGVGLVVGYNLELWGGRLHTDAVFAAAWGAFPLVTAYYAQTGTVRPGAALGAAFAYGLSRAQRVLSTEARYLRRRVTSVAGERLCADGSRQPVSRATMLEPLEQALVALSWATCALGGALVLSRIGH
jgi:hypothetical protein